MIDWMMNVVIWCTHDEVDLKCDWDHTKTVSWFQRQGSSSISPLSDGLMDDEEDVVGRAKLITGNNQVLWVEW